MTRHRRWAHPTLVGSMVSGLLLTGAPFAVATPVAASPAAAATDDATKAEPRPVPEPEPEPEPEPGPFEPPADGFTWRVPDRFGVDDDRDGFVDSRWIEYGDGNTRSGRVPETYDPTWVHPKLFPVDFDGCPTAEEAERSGRKEPTANVYTWHIDGSPVAHERSCRRTHEFSAQDDHHVTLTVTMPDGTVDGPYDQQVYVRDLLIVALGDSYGSGEGNPDRFQTLDSQGNLVREARWVDRRCHRSMWAGPAQAALRLERSDPKTSVTFLSFACSGATIGTIWGSDPFFPYAPAGADAAGTGVLGEYAGVEPRGAPKLPSQLDQLRAAVAVPGAPGSFRPVDALVISAGGNDAGFAPLAAQCVLWGGCTSSTVETRSDAARRVPLEERFSQDVAALAGIYDTLGSELRALGEKVPIARTYVTEYPDSTTDDDGRPCEALLEDVLDMRALIAAGVGGSFLFTLLSGPVVGTSLVWLIPLLAVADSMAIEGEEVALAATVAPSINAQLHAAARRHRWEYVGGISDRFVGHGYCSSDPYVRRAPESSQLQGPWTLKERVGLHNDTKGTLHPTVTGHAVYADRLFAGFAAQFGVGAGASSFTFSPQIDGSTSRRGWAGWYTGRCQAPAGGCTSDAAVATVEVLDGIGLKETWFSVNGEPGCPPEGVVCTSRLVAPGTHRWTFELRADGPWQLQFWARNRRGEVQSFEREVKVDLHDPIVTVGAVPGTPLGVRFDGGDGPGSGIREIVHTGLWHGAPGRAAPGLVVPVDLGGTYHVRFRAVDHAGRHGPWQTQPVDVHGPTMSGTPAAVSQYCTQHSDEDGRVNNGDDGLGVMVRTTANRATAVPARAATSAGSTAVRGSSPVNGGNEDCSSAGWFSSAPLNVRAGTTGLAPGDPVVVEATVTLAGALTETFDVDDGAIVTRAYGSGYVRIAGADDPAGTALVVGAAAKRHTHTSPGLEVGGYVQSGYHLRSNREAPQSWSEHRSHPSCTWPCSVPRARLHFPGRTFTVTFASHVGARHLVEGAADVFTQAYSDAGTTVSASADVIAALDVRPAPGFEGLELVRGDPPPNRAPDAGDDTAVTDEDVAVVVDVAANDSDPDGDPLAVVAVSDPPHGVASMEPDGGVVYTPDADYAGTDTFTYTVDDGYAGTASATVTVTVAPVDDHPVAADDAAITDEDTPVTVAVLANDADADGDALNVTAASDASAGTVTVASDGTITYTPEAGHLGEDSFTYTISDGTTEAQATVVVTTTARTISVEDTTVGEGDLGATPARFTLRLSSPSPRDVAVSFRTSDGTAGPLDYLAAAGAVTIPRGASTVEVDVLVIGDRTGEPDETFYLDISTPVGVQLGRGRGVATISDDD